MSTTTTGRGRPRRTRRSPAEQQRLEQLTAARDQLDAAAAERRRREDEALAGYAATAGEADEVIAARDVALADLDRQRQAVIDGAAAKLADIDARKTAVLAVLNELGRSADELSALFIRGATGRAPGPAGGYLAGADRQLEPAGRGTRCSGPGGGDREQPRQPFP